MRFEVDRRRRTSIAAAGVALLISLQPVSNDDLWWQSSRGRAVLSGAVAPSRHLLPVESAADADWLGGVPLWGMHQLFGPSGFMAWKLMVCGLIAWAIWRAAADIAPSLRLLLTFLGLISTRAAWDPSPQGFDVLAVALVYRLSRSGPLRWPALASLTVAWANLAPLFVLGLVISGANSLAYRPGRRNVVVLLVMLLAGSLSPRGLLGWRDSLVQLIPRLAADGAVLQHTSWRPLLSAAWGPAEWAFALLSFLGVVALLSAQIPFGRGIALLLSLAGGWTCSANLAPAGMWVTLLLCDHWQPFAGFNRATSYVLLGAIAAATVSLSAGWLPNSPQRLGWGIDPWLDVEPLREALSSVDLDGTAFCADTRAAGFGGWILPASIKVFDEPRRALLGGRLREHVLLCDDLAAGRQYSYFRDDGSQGGWWTPLESRRTRLLLVPNQRTDVIEGLNDTLWRPLALASSVVPYGRAGDAGANRQIVEVLKQQRLLAWGEWSAANLPTTGSSTHLDLWGLATRSPDASVALSQARFLQASSLPVASLRLLFPVLREAPSRDALELFVRCQQELAYQERMLIGSSSRWRANCAGAMHDEEWLRAMSEYRRGNLAAAVTVLRTDDAEALYAKGWLQLESGDLRAAEALRSLIAKYPTSELVPLAQHVLESL